MTSVYHAVQFPLFPLVKVCTFCDPPTEKPIMEFYRDKSTKDGYKNRCKKCEKARSNDYNATHRQENLASYHLRYSIPEWREQKLEKDRLRYAANPVQKNAQSLAWAKTHPEAANQRVARRKALKASLTVSEVNYQRILERKGYWCYICEKPILSHHKIEFDHVIPLFPRKQSGVLAGTHSEENISPTHDICNRRKHNRLLEEMTTFQRRGPDDMETSI